MPNEAATLDAAPLLAARLGTIDSSLGAPLWQPLSQKLGGQTRNGGGLAFALHEVLIELNSPIIDQGVATKIQAVMTQLVPNHPGVAAEGVRHFQGMTQARQAPDDAAARRSQRDEFNL